MDELPLSQSTVSQHLKGLKEAGLIKGDIDGVKVCYCIVVVLQFLSVKPIVFCFLLLNYKSHQIKF